MDGYGLVWLGGCGHWLPVRLPGILVSSANVRTIRTFPGSDRSDAGVAAGHVPGHPRGFRVEVRASLLAGCGGGLENRRDLFNLVKLTRGDLHH